MSQPIRCGIVPPLAMGFYDRPETTSAIRAALRPGTSIILTSADVPQKQLGPTGKTQLAVSVAESLWRGSSIDLIAWVDASSQASMLSGYARAAAALGSAPVGDAESAAAGFVAGLATSKLSWLVVLDGAADAADLGGWPEGPGGSTVVTAAAVPAGADAATIPVAMFSTREALGYLTGRLSADTDMRQGAADLVDDLDGEPLALVQASAVIASTGMSCRDYRAMFARRREQIAAANGELPQATTVTWTLAYDEAERISGGLSLPAVLVFSALLGSQGIPAQVFTTAAAGAYFATSGIVDPGRVRTALACLERVGLLTVSWAATPPAIWINPAIQALIRAAASTAMIEQVTKVAADALVEVWPSEEPYAWIAEPLRSCAASLQTLGGDTLWGDRWHPLVPRVGQSLQGTGLTSPAVGYWAEVAAATDRMLSPEHPDALVATERVAAACLAAGRGAEAVAWYQRVVSDQLRTSGHDHPVTFAARISLGRALLAAGQPGDGINVLSSVVTDCERTLGPAHATTLDARDQLAVAYRAAGQLTDASHLYRRSLADRERVQGKRHPQVMTTRALLAALVMADGNVKDAISQWKRVLSDREHVLGPDHPETITARASLATAYQAAGKMAAALQHAERAYADSQRVLGPDDPGTLACGADLAHAYYTVGRIGDAMTLLRDTAARCERVLPPDDPLTVTVRTTLANVAGE
jgi:tetratricopeptide (TPR) repeat protein